MRYTTYSKYLPELLDAVNLQDLLDQLGDHLLQSGFAGGSYTHPFWGEFGDDDPDRSIDGLRQAILRALMESGKLSPEMLQVLRGDSTGDPERDATIQRQLSELLDQIVQRLIDEGYLTIEQAPQVPQGYQPMFGPGGQAHSAAQQVQFNLTEKGVDFLGYRTLKQLLGSIGKSSFGSHETSHLATGVEAEAFSKPYEFGDTLNLDVNATLAKALERTARRLDGEAAGEPGAQPSSRAAVQPSPFIDLDYPDLMVHQAEYRSSAATVLMLDCSHSMILYGEDRFTPAKKVALALTHLIRTQFPGDTLKVVLFHDTAEEIPLSRLTQAQVGPYHTNTAEGLKLARRLLMAQKKVHAPDHHDHRREAFGAHPARRPGIRELHGSGSQDPRRHLPRGGDRQAVGNHDQHVHACPRPFAGRLRQESVRDLAREGVLHEHDDPGPVYPHGFHAEKNEASGVKRRETESPRSHFDSSRPPPDITWGIHPREADELAQPEGAGWPPTG